MESAISSVLIASTALVALVPVLIEQHSKGKSTQNVTGRRFLIGSFCCGIVAILLTVAWFLTHNALFPIVIVCLFAAQIIWFTITALAYWWK